MRCPALGTLPQASLVTADKAGRSAQFLRDEIEWPAATLRLQLNHLAPLEEACAGDLVLLGKVVKLRRRLEWSGKALNDLLD
jgi:hypothetical protein